MNFKYYLIIIFLISSNASAFDRVTGEVFASRSEVIAANGMVATSHPLATQIGLDILKQGGNAIDAAIAANIALGLMEPTGNGIGGDLFALIWVPGKNKPEFLDASGYSGSNVDQELLSNYEQIPLNHPLSVTVPGAVAGWRELSNKYGNIPIEDILDIGIKRSTSSIKEFKGCTVRIEK